MVSITVAISPPLAGNVEVFKNNVSLGVVSITSSFEFNVGNSISLYSTPTEVYEFDHYIQPNGNETADRQYDDEITTEGDKTITAVFELIGTKKTYDCVEGSCKENVDGSGEYIEPTCNDDCVPSAGGFELKDAVFIAGIGFVAWLFLKKLPEESKRS